MLLLILLCSQPEDIRQAHEAGMDPYWVSAS